MRPSNLYVPGDRPDLVRKALDRVRPGAVILDLEDGVHADAKDAARRLTTQWLRSGELLTIPAEDTLDPTVAPVGDGAPRAVVRIDSAALTSDLDAVLSAGPRPTELIMAKCTVDSLDAAAAYAGDALPPVVALVESAVALVEVHALASHPTVVGLALGEADLTADLGIRVTADDPALEHIRLMVVIASAAAGRRPPTAPVYIDVRDLDGLRTSCTRLRDLGFGSRSAVHPAQVAVIEEVFTATDADLRDAAAIIAEFDRRRAAGDAVYVDGSGRMVDEAVVRRARALVTDHERVDHDAEPRSAERDKGVDG